MADLLVDSLRNVLPDADDDELQQHATEMRTRAPGVPDEQLIQAAGGAQQDVARTQKVNSYVADKFGLGGQFAPEARQALVDQNKEDASGPAWAAGLAALGAGIAGRDAGAAGANILNMQRQGRESKLNEFDKGKQLAMQDQQYGQSQEKLARESDPNSEESKLAQSLAIDMGMSPEQASKLSAAKFKDFSGVLKNKYEIAERAKAKEYEIAERNKSREDDRAFKGEQNQLQREALAANKAAMNADREERTAMKLADKDQKLAEKEQALKTPYGLANSVDDAKLLKSAHESKQNFDSKIQEMIKLREDYGGETANREAVARGKQLSKDLLLEYKNMAKLGVLSQSDEKIINAIIPDDPLAFTASSLVGQDPILSNLKAFQKDSERDFKTKVATRTREGLSNYAANPPGKQLDISMAGGSDMVRMQAPDGSIRKIPKDQVKAALAAGGKLADKSSAIVEE